MNLTVLPELWQGLETTYKVALIVLLLALTYITPYVYSLLTSRYIYFNRRKLFEFSDAKAKQRYQSNARYILKAGLETGNPFYVNAGRGPILVLPNRYAREVYNHRDLNVSKGIGHEFLSQLPGTEGFRDDYFPDHFGVSVLKKRLGRASSLDGLIEPISAKTGEFLFARLNGGGQIRGVHISALATDVIAHTTAEMRSGEELSMNPEWYRICTSFTPNVFAAVGDLDKWPECLHHIVHMGLDSWKRLRADIEEARCIFGPVYQARKTKKRDATAQGKKYYRQDDMIDWMDEGAGGRPFDAFMAQLVNTQPFIAVTADLLTHVIADICKRPLLQDELRKEILSVVENKQIPAATMCDEFPFMDSVIKESLRVKLLYSTSVKREAECRILLSDGTLIPKGTMVAVALDCLWDESIYPNAHEFRGDRFYQVHKESAVDHTTKLTSTGMDHLGFGFGRHTCPGRFLAAAMIKIVLCHLLVKYELGAVGDDVRGMAVHQAEIHVKLRQEEVGL